MLEREKFAFFGFLIRFELHEAEKEEEGGRGTSAERALVLGQNI